jgi:hypothetical protein
MNRIIIDFPADCTEQEAAVYATGCFNQHQNDYKRLQEGYHNGTGFMFGDGRQGYCYKTIHGNYVLKLDEK